MDAGHRMDRDSNAAGAYISTSSIVTESPLRENECPSRPDALILVSLGVFAVPLISLFLSRFGWSQAATLYPAVRRPKGSNFRGISGSFHPIGNYRQVITAVLCTEGVYCEMSLIFRFGHKP